MLSQSTDLRPAAPTVYAVAGRLLCIDAPDAASAAAVECYFRDWYLDPAPRAANAEPDATIKVRPGGDPPPIPRGLESFKINDADRCFTDGHTYYLDIEGARVQFNSRRPCVVELWVREGARLGSPALSQAVFNAFSGAVRRCGLFELHSAGVVEPSSGRCALIAGASGSGKSTLTLQLATAGWGYLSDDVLLLSERAGRVEARPLRRVFAATETTVEAAGLEGRAGEHLRPANLKLRFAPQTFFPEGFVESSFPDALFFPLVTREPESGVREMTGAEALVRLLKMCPWACYDRPTSAEYLRALSLLSKQSRAYELRAGTDLLADPGRAAGLLAARVAR
jgi:hypothetical protein